MSTEARNTEQKIIASARMVFHQKGLKGARMQDIAKEAGINQALLHYYFRTKDKLFHQVFEEDLFRFMSPLATIMSKTGIDLETRISQIVEYYVEGLTESPNLPLFIVQELTSNPDRLVSIMQKIKQDNLSGNRQVMQNFIYQIEEGIREGKYKKIDPVQFIVSLIGMCVYPFIARPLLKEVFQMDEDQLHQLLIQRKEEVTNYAFSILLKP